MITLEPCVHSPIMLPLLVPVPEHQTAPQTLPLTRCAVKLVLVDDQLLLDGNSIDFKKAQIWPQKRIVE